MVIRHFTKKNINVTLLQNMQFRTIGFVLRCWNSTDVVHVVGQTRNRTNVAR
jgi:hypothetical protein